MFCIRSSTGLEKKFFRTLNRVLEPTIRAGLGNPWLVPVGAVVMETVGRKSGRGYNIPVLASAYGDLLVVSTVRGRSQWVKNIAARPEIHVWLRGKRRSCTAYVVATGELQSDQEEASPAVQRLTAVLRTASKAAGISFAVLQLDATQTAQPAAEALAQV